uniref:Uncharacterized protein n=1 Tax=viral metagenome TaxID=1070528 RepID=A0A6C0ILW3_9ZZZZ
MSDFFKSVTANAKAVEEKFLGPDYKYYEFIKSPSAMGMSAEGSIDAITHDISGLIGYVSLLSTGKSGASTTGNPLGNKFFLETGATCKDTASGNKVPRSLYVNNVPDGSIPFISNATGVEMDGMYGLIPGTLSNLSQINPMQIFGAFMEGITPQCQLIEMETISVNNEKTMKTGYVTNNDITNMNAKWFPGGVKPAIKNIEAFTLLSDSEEYRKYMTKYNKTYKKNKNKQDYSLMPDDGLIKIYYSSLTVLVLYIFLKMFQKR